MVKNLDDWGLEIAPGEDADWTTEFALPERHASRYRCLVVDDEFTARSDLERVLGDLAVVETASNFDQASEILTERGDEFDLIVLDQKLDKGRLGTELRDLLEQRGIWTVPVIMASAFFDEETKADLAAVDTTATIVALDKPYKDEALHAAAKTCLLLRQKLSLLEHYMKKQGEDDRLQTLGLATGGITHDVRSALAGVVTYIKTVDRIMDGCLQPDTRSQLGELLEQLGDPANDLPIVLDLYPDLKSSAQRAERLADDLTRLAGGEWDKANLTGRYDLRGIIERCTTDLRPILEKYNPHKLRIETKIPDTPIHCTFDVSALDRVCLNLAKNAAEALAHAEGNDEKSGVIRVSLTELTQDQKSAIREYIPAEQMKGRIALFTCYNTGPSIPEDLIPFIFIPLAAKMKAKDLGIPIPKKESTGLGLPISYRLIHAHGGVLFAQVPEIEGDVAYLGKGEFKVSLGVPAQGKGTCFGFTIPIDHLEEVALERAYQFSSEGALASDISKGKFYLAEEIEGSPLSSKVHLRKEKVSGRYDAFFTNDSTHATFYASGADKSTVVQIDKTACESETTDLAFYGLDAVIRASAAVSDISIHATEPVRQYARQLNANVFIPPRNL